MSKSRRFEFVDATSNKFWEVSVAAATVTVRYGRIGTEGKTQVKSYDSPAVATATAEKQIAEKVKNGYLEVGGAAEAKEAPPAPNTRRPYSPSSSKISVTRTMTRRSFTTTKCRQFLRSP